MDYSNEIEKYADKFILSAYKNNGRISEREIPFAVPSRCKHSVNTLLKHYGTFQKVPVSVKENIRIYTLTKNGIDFASEGGYKGKQERKKKDKNRSIRKELAGVVGVIIPVLTVVNITFSLHKWLPYVIFLFVLSAYYYIAFFWDNPTKK